MLRSVHRKCTWARRLVNLTVRMATDTGNGSYVADNQLKPPAGLGRPPPDDAADREAREASTGSEELHSTWDGGMGICIVALMQLFALLFRRAGLPLPPC
jgi:hypothetical protein